MNSKPYAVWIADYYGTTLAFPVFGLIHAQYREKANRVIEVPADGDWKRPIVLLKSREGVPILNVATTKWDRDGKIDFGFVFDPAPGEHLDFTFDDLRDRTGNVQILLDRFNRGEL